MSYLASKPINDIQDWLPALARLEGAYSNNTLRAYRSDIQAFETWSKSCQSQFLPAAAESVAAFITAQAQTCSSSTLKRRLAAIRKIHRLLKMDNPIGDEEVVIAMKRALRSKRSRPQQALGLTRDLRDKLINACPADIFGARDRSIIAIGYDTLCRRAELVGLCVEDITRSSDGTGRILIRRSKNDPYGEGRVAYLSEGALELLDAWLTAAEIRDGFLFRRIHGQTVSTEALHPYTINRILKKSAASAGMPQDSIEHLSGHSMRVGAAQDLITSGLDILPIMQAGGWKTLNVVGRYVESANLGQLLQRARGPYSPAGNFGKPIT